MKILTISDLHGKNDWVKYTSQTNDFDKIIFLGDYTDSFTISNQDIYNNLSAIIHFKKFNFTKVELLLGNHDLQYIYLNDINFSCTGYRPEAAYDLHDVFIQNINLFSNSYQYKNYIWSHAGIQDYWFSTIFKGDINLNIATQLNYPNNREQQLALFHVGRRRGGINQIGGIFWCDDKELKKPLQNYIQIVGHTARKNIFLYEYKNAKVYFTDCLDKISDCLILNL